MARSNNNNNSRPRPRGILSRFSPLGVRRQHTYVNRNQLLQQREEELKKVKDQLTGVRRELDIAKGELVTARNKLKIVEDKLVTATSGPQLPVAVSSLYPLLCNHYKNIVGKEIPEPKDRDDDHYAAYITEIEEVYEELLKIKSGFKSQWLRRNEEFKSLEEELAAVKEERDEFAAMAELASDTDSDSDYEDTGDEEPEEEELMGEDELLLSVVGDTAAPDGGEGGESKEMNAGEGGSTAVSATVASGGTATVATSSGGTDTATASTEEYTGVTYKEPIIVEDSGVASGAVTPEMMNRHFERLVPKDKKKREELIAQLSEEDREMYTSIEENIRKQRSIFIETMKKNSESRYKTIRFKGVAYTIGGIVQELNTSFTLMTILLNGGKMNQEMVKDFQTFVTPSKTYQTNYMRSRLETVIGRIEKNENKKIQKKDLHLFSLPRVAVYGEAVSMKDRVNGKTISFGRSAVTGAPNVDPELQYYDFDTEMIGNFSPDIAVDVSKVQALVLLEKKGHVTSISECDNENMPNIIAISCGINPSREAFVLAQVIMNRYETETGEKLPIFTAFDLNGGGINGQERYAEEVTGLDYTPLITPELVEKSNVVLVGATKKATITKFRNSVGKMQRKFKDYGDPKAPVNIEELLCRDLGTSIGKFILDLVKTSLESVQGNDD